jgi:hypothetical protein
VSTKREWFAAFRYVAPADLEDWLETQAHEGWRLEHVGQWSSILMTFQKGEPATYRYVIDAQVSPRPDYLATYQDAGWEHLGRMASAHVWRRRYDDLRPEAFTDAETVRARSQRFVGAVTVAASVLALGGLAMLLASFFADLSAGDANQMLAAGILFASMAVLLIFVAVRIWRQRDR